MLTRKERDVPVEAPESKSKNGGGGVNLLNDEPKGRKYAALLIALVMLLVGFLLSHALDIDSALYETFAKWLIFALGIYVTGNLGAIGVKKIYNHGGGKHVQKQSMEE